MRYVDGFVLVVPKKNRAAYVKMAREGGKMWKKYGALEYVECIGNDLNPNMGPGHPIMNFPKLAKLKSNEDVWYSFIIYKSKAHRNEVNTKVMKQMTKDMEKHKNMKMPFDMKKMCYGGFQSMVDM